MEKTHTTSKCFAVAISVVLLWQFVAWPSIIATYHWITSYSLVKTAYIDDFKTFIPDYVYCDRPDDPTVKYKYEFDGVYTIPTSEYRASITPNQFDEYYYKLDDFLGCMKTKYHHDELDRLNDKSPSK